jgi:hypothetical protein
MNFEGVNCSCRPILMGTVLPHWNRQSTSTSRSSLPEQRQRSGTKMAMAKDQVSMVSAEVDGGVGLTLDPSSQTISGPITSMTHPNSPAHPALFRQSLPKRDSHMSVTGMLCNPYM